LSSIINSKISTIKTIYRST